MNPASNAAFAPDELAPPSAQATGSLADAALPGASFTPEDFAVELSQTSLAEADEILKATLEEAMQVVGGNRAFLALVEVTTGELALRFTAGQGWTDEVRRLRVNVQTIIEHALNISHALSDFWRGARRSVRHKKKPRLSARLQVINLCSSEVGAFGCWH